MPTITLPPGTDAALDSLDWSSISESPPSISEARSAFLDDLALANRPPATIKTYRSLLGSLPDAPMAAFDGEACRAALRERIRRHAQPATLLTLYRALGAFARWCVDQRYLAASPLEGIPAPRVPDKPHRYLSREEMGRVWQAAGAANELLLLFLAAGLRANELVSLRWQDVREDRVIVAFGKGRKVRAVVLTEPMRVRLEALRRSDGRIFALSTPALRSRLATIGRRAGVPGLHPHLLRHTFASHFLKDAGIESIEALRVLGGWSASSAMPAKYARSVLEDAALERSRQVPLDLFGETEAPPPGGNDGAAA